MTIRLCEGEGEYFDDNLRLGVFDISDIPPRPRGQVPLPLTPPLPRSMGLTDLKGSSLVD